MAMLGAIVAIERETKAAPQDMRRLATLLAELTGRALVVGAMQCERAKADMDVVPADSELEAVAAAMRLAGDDHALVAAADLAHPSQELMRYLLHIRAGHEAVVPLRADGSRQPLCALYHGSCAPRAQSLIAAGERCAEALLAEVEVREVTLAEVAKFGDPGGLLARRGSEG